VAKPLRFVEILSIEERCWKELAMLEILFEIFGLCGFPYGGT
jgi:hypothetical protein